MIVKSLKQYDSDLVETYEPQVSEIYNLYMEKRKE